VTYICQKQFQVLTKVTFDLIPLVGDKVQKLANSPRGQTKFYSFAGTALLIPAPCTNLEQSCMKILK